MSAECFPKNPYIRNGAMARLYLFCLRHQWRRFSRLVGTALGCEISCPVPERLFLPHPTGIVTGVKAQLHNDVVLLQQVTLGCLSPYAGVLENDGDPILKEGVYVGPGAKILGRVTIGEWSVIGANAVITQDVPPYSMVVGYNKLLPMTTKEFEATGGGKRLAAASALPVAR